MFKKFFKKAVAVAGALTMAFSMSAVNVYAASSEWSHGDSSGYVEYSTHYASGTTSCFGNHTMVSVSIEVRYVCNDKVYYDETSYDDYLTAEAEIGDSSYEVLGVRGYHTVHFENGSCSGTTQAGIWN